MKTVKNILGWTLVGFLVLLLLGLFGPRVKDDPGARVKAVRACHERGKAYYREIGSFPYLSDGRDARQVAWKMCETSRGAAF